jgi:hypothetical protein
MPMRIGNVPWPLLGSGIRFNNSDVALYGISEKLVGSLIRRTFVRGPGTFDAIELNEYNPLVEAQLKDHCRHTAGEYSASSGL